MSRGKYLYYIYCIKHVIIEHGTVVYRFIFIVTVNGTIKKYVKKRI